MKLSHCAVLLFWILSLAVAQGQSRRNQWKMYHEDPGLHEKDSLWANEIGLDSLWSYLLVRKGGCLLGSQYDTSDHVPDLDSDYIGDVSIFNKEPRWHLIFDAAKETITPFLVRQLADTSVTRVHTCPFGIATTGEVAVYCLQRIHKINWYDFPEFSDYRNKEGFSDSENPQRRLRNILEDEQKRKLMGERWLSLGPEGG